MKWRLFDELSGIELYELLCFRQTTFIVEQRSPYPDLDGLDQKSVAFGGAVKANWPVTCI